MTYRFLIPLSIFFITTILTAQNNITGSIKGKVLSESNKKPLEMVNVVVHASDDSTIITGTVTDKNGRFEITKIHFGTYFLSYTILGHEEKHSLDFTLDADHPTFNPGSVKLKETVLNMDEVTVTSTKASLNMAIDRKVYNVQQDVMSSTGSASDLLQNIPSVQVDIDGNVSLRGSTNVLILINGNPSPLMGKNRADALQQMPANSIEKIEVITNPSAKYKPDGTSGIINIVMKKESKAGMNGSVGANAGNNRRSNGNASVNYNTGAINIFGSGGLRQDDRNNYSTEDRIQYNNVSAVTSYYTGSSKSIARPRSTIGTLGFDYNFDQSTSAGLSGNYHYRGFTRNERAAKTYRNNLGAVTEDYDRFRLDYEYEKEGGFTTYLLHKFPEEDHKLRAEYEANYQSEQEDNRYADVFRYPLVPTQYDNTIIKQIEAQRRLAIEYAEPLGEGAMMEAGYEGDFNRREMNYYGSLYDTAQHQFLTDAKKTNLFIYNEAIHAVYGTYENSFGLFSLLAGIRGELSFIRSDLASRDSVIDNSYFSYYPSLHLAYKISELAALQLNYSRRVNRPEGDELNPFPEYQDPRNIRAGNPRLKPEYIHSVEFGCQLQTDNITLVPSIFYRNKYNGFTSVTMPINDTTLLTTQTNLSTDQSAGLEIVATGSSNGFFAANASGNVFYEQIDASNLGYSSNRSTITWSGSLSCNFNFATATMVQVNSNYRSARLTPQGEYRPTLVLNLGLRQDLFDDQLSITATVSDLFKTQKRKLKLDSPLLKQDVISYRDFQIMYIGLTYHFGRESKKSKEKSLQYEEG